MTPPTTGGTILPWGTVIMGSGVFPGGGTGTPEDVSDDYCGYGDAVNVANALSPLIPGCYAASLVNVGEYTNMTINGEPAPSDVQQWGIATPDDLIGPDGKTVVFTAGSNVGLAKRLMVQPGLPGSYGFLPEPIGDPPTHVFYAIRWFAQGQTPKAVAIATLQQTIRVAQAQLAKLQS